MHQAYQEGFEQGQKDGLLKFQEDAINALKSLETPKPKTNFYQDRIIEEEY